MVADLASFASMVEDINKDYPVRDLRWTVLHLYNASEDNLKRMKSLARLTGGFTAIRP